MAKIKKIFLTFPSSRLDIEDKNIETIISVLDKSNKFKIGYRWFDVREKIDNYIIYEKSTKALLNTDLVIAEASVPSIGVGQQIAFAMSHKIPVLILVKSSLKNDKKSLFLKGIKSAKVSFFYYKSSTDIKDNLLSIVESKINDDLEKLNFMATKSIKKFLIKESQKRKISQSEFLRQIIIEWQESKR